MFKRLIPLLILALLLMACGLPAAVTATVAPPNPTLTQPAPILTDTPTSGAPVSATADLSQTDTPGPGGPTAPLPQPPSGTRIAHLPAGQAIKITFIKMLDATNGWGVGGLGGNSDHVLRTADGGLTWKDLTPPEPVPSSPQTPKKALGFFMDTQRAWVVFFSPNMPAPSQAYIWYTTDGGATWNYSALTEPALDSEAFVASDLSFVDAQHGWVMAHLGAGMNHDYYALLATTDGGVTWNTLISPDNDTSQTQSCAKSGLVFDSTQAGWMTVNCMGVVDIPYFFKTQDGGATWTSVNLPEPAISGTNPFDPNQGYCDMTPPTFLSSTSVDLVLKCTQYATNPSTEQSFLYETTDGGASWKTYPYPGGSLQFIGTQTAFALGRTIQRSADAGHTWSPVKIVNWDGQFSFVDANTAWAVATDNGQIALVKTTDGAATWQELHPQIAP